MLPADGQAPASLVVAAFPRGACEEAAQQLLHYACWALCPNARCIADIYFEVAVVAVQCLFFRAVLCIYIGSGHCEDITRPKECVRNSLLYAIFLSSLHFWQGTPLDACIARGSVVAGKTLDKASHVLETARHVDDQHVVNTILRMFFAQIFEGQSHQYSMWSFVAAVVGWRARSSMAAKLAHEWPRTTL